MADRAEYIKGLRALADILEAHPGLPLPYQGSSPHYARLAFSDFLISKDPRADMAAASPATARELAEQIAALTAHLTTTPIPAPDRAAVLTQIAEIQQGLFDVLVALTLAVAAEHHGTAADEVVAAADEAGCLAGHSRDACHDAAQAAEDLIAAHLAQNGDTR